MTRYTMISLDEIAGEATELMEWADALEPGDEPDAVIIERVNGRAYIVDGFHRTAGYRAWADAQDMDYSDIQIRVLESDEEDLLAAAAEPGGEQSKALERLYQMVEED